MKFWFSTKFGFSASKHTLFVPSSYIRPTLVQWLELQTLYLTTNQPTNQPNNVPTNQITKQQQTKQQTNNQPNNQNNNQTTNQLLNQPLTDKRTISFVDRWA